MTEPSDSLTLDNPPESPFVLVNLKQTPEERREKYWLCRSFGLNSYQAMRRRDWRLSKIERALGIEETYNPSTKAYDRNMTPFLPITNPV